MASYSLYSLKKTGASAVDQYQAIIEIIALSMGVAWASGVNLYAVLLVLGLGGASGNIALPNELA